MDALPHDRPSPSQAELRAAERERRRATRDRQDLRNRARELVREALATEPRRLACIVLATLVMWYLVLPLVASIGGSSQPPAGQPGLAQATAATQSVPADPALAPEPARAAGHATPARHPAR